MSSKCLECIEQSMEMKKTQTENELLINLIVLAVATFFCVNAFFVNAFSIFRIQFLPRWEADMKVSFFVFSSLFVVFCVRCLQTVDIWAGQEWSDLRGQSKLKSRIKDIKVEL